MSLRHSTEDEKVPYYLCDLCVSVVRLNHGDTEITEIIQTIFRAGDKEDTKENVNLVFPLCPLRVLVDESSFELSNLVLRRRPPANQKRDLSASEDPQYSVLPLIA